MHKLSMTVTNACLSYRWIQEEDKLWCAYAVEKKLITICFFLLMLPLTMALDVLPQAALFSCVFYLLRRRLGGWHAPYSWLCQVLSVALVLGITLFVGPTVIALPPFMILCMDAVVMIVAFIQKPVYPFQLHFDPEIKKANTKKKNHILLFIIALHLCFGFVTKVILIYSLLAVLTGVISVYIEIIHQKICRKKDYYEKT